ncbi:MAG: DUF4386 domain-containing protein [Actinomycetes bacterium]
MIPSSEICVPRLVGAAFVAQFCTSLAAGVLSRSILSGDVNDVLAAAGTDATQLRMVVVLELLTSIGIIALTSLLYVALRETVRWMATVAFALWVAEATVLAVNMLGLYALLDLGETSLASGSAASASDLAVGGFAVGLHEHAADIGMLFFGAGALLWYSLFIRTQFVPRWLGIWGLASAVPVCLATLLNVWDRNPQSSMLFYVAYIPFEFVVGTWLLVKGSPHRPDATDATSAESLPPEQQPTLDLVDVHEAATTPT